MIDAKLCAGEVIYCESILLLEDQRELIKIISSEQRGSSAHDIFVRSEVPLPYATVELSDAKPARKRNPSNATDSRRRERTRTTRSIILAEINPTRIIPRTIRIQF